MDASAPAQQGAAARAPAARAPAARSSEDAGFDVTQADVSLTEVARLCCTGGSAAARDDAPRRSNVPGQLLVVAVAVLFLAVAGDAHGSATKARAPAAGARPADSLQLTACATGVPGRRARQMVQRLPHERRVGNDHQPGARRHRPGTRRLVRSRGLLCRRPVSRLRGARARAHSSAPLGADASPLSAWRSGARCCAAAWAPSSPSCFRCRPSRCPLRCTWRRCRSGAGARGCAASASASTRTGPRARRAPTPTRWRALCRSTSPPCPPAGTPSPASRCVPAAGS